MSARSPLRYRAVLAFSLVAGCASVATAQERSVDFDSLMNLSLVELLDVEVTTVSRRGQSLSSAPAAVFVINQSDIRRSGAHSIPDLLRIVPGVNVAQIDGNKWAITARGVNGRVAGKLLVLVDGRSVYSPLFSGVFWDQHDMDLSSIERIEVVRGPGATLWGANAVNGVINIITESANTGAGGLASANLGADGSVTGVVRFGGSMGTDWNYRVFGKARDHEGNIDTAGNDTADTLQSSRVGLRIDRDRADADAMSFSAELYDSELGVTAIRATLTPPYQIVSNELEESAGGFAMFSWNHTVSDRSQFTFQAYYDDTTRDLLVDHEFGVETFDIDFQYEMLVGARHNVVWGAGYRRATDNVVTSTVLPINPPSREQRWKNAFVQDEIELKPDSLYLTLGTKLDDTNYTADHYEFQPNIRLRWNAGNNGTFWASAAKAVRLPSRGDLDGHVTTTVLAPLSAANPAPLPMALPIVGNPDLKAEALLSTEIGYRVQPTERFAVDIATFLFDYDRDRSTELQPTVCQPQGTVVALDPSCVASAQFLETPLLVGNGNSGETFGWEVVTDWWPTDSWRMQSTVSVLRRRSRTADPLDVGSAAVALLGGPEYQATLRSMWNLGPKTELDMTVRYVDEIEQSGIDDYTAVDVRFGWTPAANVQLSVVGRNLVAGDHIEFVSELHDVVPIQILQRAYLEVLWSF